jgi:hypothetical protein
LIGRRFIESTAFAETDENKKFIAQSHKPWRARRSLRLKFRARCCRIVPNRKRGAVVSAVLVHVRVEPAHFDWRWRERPVLALLAWEAWLAIR